METIEIMKTALERLQARIAADAAEFFPALKRDLDQVSRLKMAVLALEYTQVQLERRKIEETLAKSVAVTD